MRAAAPLLALLLLAGCRAPGPVGSELSIPASRYDEAFAAAREAVRDLGFRVDRVDARAGVLTTAPKATAGLATPWDLEQTYLDQEWEDLLNRHYRTIRIEFEPAEARPEPGEALAMHDVLPIPDVRAHEGDLRAVVRVVLEREYRPGLRPQRAAVRMSSVSGDRMLARRGMFPRYTVPIGRDEHLESRLVNQIRRRLGIDPA